MQHARSFSTVALRHGDRRHDTISGIRHAPNSRFTPASRILNPHAPPECFLHHAVGTFSAVRLAYLLSTQGSGCPVRRLIGITEVPRPDARAEAQRGHACGPFGRLECWKMRPPQEDVHERVCFSSLPSSLSEIATVQRDWVIAGPHCILPQWPRSASPTHALYEDRDFEVATL
ncbi:hypothetical protein OH76DRAFT_966912 [Lentinus brumalis]|uniref:Uncharacterized protein n=1 Tax=Lentinus brumalis TaxID=2498619 RepID=A0A371DPP6_9APHY|nr:hypothetical protein OH76DRAFT_966912 [Polyporus brumalis]